MNLPLSFQVETLPSKKIGSPGIGEITLPQFKDLTANEQEFIEQHSQHIPNLKREAARMAQTIAPVLGVTILTAYNGLLQRDYDLLANHLDQVLTIEELTAQVVRQRPVVVATAMLKLRWPIQLEKELETADELRREQICQRLEKLKEWTITDTGDGRKIHPALVFELNAFAAAESNGGEMVSAPPTEDDVKKS